MFRGGEILNQVQDDIQGSSGWHTEEFKKIPDGILNLDSPKPKPDLKTTVELEKLRISIKTLAEQMIKNHKFSDVLDSIDHKKLKEVVEKEFKNEDWQLSDLDLNIHSNFDEVKEVFDRVVDVYNRFFNWSGYYLLFL